MLPQPPPATFATMRPSRLFDSLDTLFPGRWWDVVQTIVAGALLLALSYSSYRVVRGYRADLAERNRGLGEAIKSPGR